MIDEDTGKEEGEDQSDRPSDEGADSRSHGEGLWVRVSTAKTQASPPARCTVAVSQAFCLLSPSLLAVLVTDELIRKDRGKRRATFESGRSGYCLEHLLLIPVMGTTAAAVVLCMCKHSARYHSRCITRVNMERRVTSAQLDVEKRKMRADFHDASESRPRLTVSPQAGEKNGTLIFELLTRSP